MYLFILESFGTQELILIGLVALIIFGPRKLPELAKTIGKTMAEFRKVTGDFRSTWEKEVEEDKKMLQSLGEDPLNDDNTTEKEATKIIEEKQLATPQIKELNPAEIKKLFKNKGIQTESIQTEDSPQPEQPQTELTTLGKRDWL